MAPNDTTTTGDDVTLFPAEHDQGSARQETDAPPAQGAPAADAPAPRRRAPRRSTKKATTIEPSVEPTVEPSVEPTVEPTVEPAPAAPVDDAAAAAPASEA